MPRGRRWPIIRSVRLVGAIVVCACGAAYADEAADRAEAARLAKAAMEAATEDAQYVRAAELFQRAYDLSRELEYLLDVGVAYRKAGWAHQAVTAFRRYLALAGESVPAPLRAQIDTDVATLVATSGLVRVSTAGAPATISLDGRAIGLASREQPLEVLMPVGPDHALRAEREGYDAVTEALVVHPGEERALVLEPRPRPTKATLVIASIPTAAQLSLGTGGGDLGVAPRTIDVAPGDYEVFARLPGYAPAREALHVTAGDRRELTLRLSKLPTWWWRDVPRRQPSRAQGQRRHGHHVRGDGRARRQRRLRTGDERAARDARRDRGHAERARADQRHRELLRARGLVALTRWRTPRGPGSSATRRARSPRWSATRAACHA